MGKVRDAMGQLALMTVSGVTLRDFDEVGRINAADLPLMFPVFVLPLKVDGTEFRSAHFVNDGEYTFRFPHVCLLSLSGMSTLEQKQDQFMTVLENYLNALRTDVDLGANLAIGYTVEFRYGEVVFGGKAYLGFIAIHTWVFEEFASA